MRECGELRNQMCLKDWHHRNFTTNSNNITTQVKLVADNAFGAVIWS
jgi:hypothetical protein